MEIDVPQPTCQWPDCGTALTRKPGKGRNPKWCTTHRRAKHNAENPDSTVRTCTVAGCSRPLRARGLCGTHYNQQHAPDRHRTVAMICDGCGVTVHKEPSRRNRYANLYCTPECRDTHRWAELRASRKQVVIYKPPPLWHRAVTAIGTDKQRPSRTWTVGVCPQCGDGFTDIQPQTRFCSPACARRWHRTAWKIKTNRIIPPSVRALVYDRDAATCQLCSTRVDMALPPSHPYGPTLDHIICQSWTLIPDHSAQNLRLAHRMCNSIRGDERDARQAA